MNLQCFAKPEIISHMRKVPFSLYLLLAVVMFPLSGFGSANDVVFTVTRKKLDEKKSSGQSETSHSKEILYSVKVLNKGFSEYENVIIKYNIYYETPLLGSSNKPELRTAQGSENLPSLPRNKPLEFTTSSITLTSDSLNPSWYFADGSKREAKDKVVGVWFKAFDAEGKLIGEYFNRSTVTRKYKWLE